MPNPTDRLGVAIAVGDLVTVIVYGSPVRLGDCGRQFRVTGYTRAGNLTHDHGSDVAAGHAVPPSCVAVARRDGLPGHEGNRPPASD